MEEIDTTLDNEDYINFESHLSFVSVGELIFVFSITYFRHIANLFFAKEQPKAT